MATSQTLRSTVKLASGDELPVLGFGVWDSPSNLTTKSCLEALKVGYRHIDTAQLYGNEAEVGEAVKQSGLKREDVFITSKIYTPAADGPSTYQKCLDSVKKIVGETGYLDLLLIHNANVGAEPRKKMWLEMEKLHEEGKLKSIGVSNYGVAHLKDLKSYGTKVWPPAVNQLELHPWLQQREVIDYCNKHGIAIEAYCPLVRNQKSDNPTLNAIAKKHDKTTAQVLIRYSVQKGWVPLPKSDNPGRIAQNADVFDFELSKDDMEKLDAQPQEPALVLAVDNESEE